MDESYDAALQEFFTGYHAFIDLLCRVAANQQNLSEAVINLSAMVAYEGVPLHSPYFAKLWTEIYHLEQIDKNYIGTLCHSSFFIDYVDAVLLDERQSLNNHHIYQFFTNYFPKVCCVLIFVLFLFELKFQKLWNSVQCTSPIYGDFFSLVGLQQHFILYAHVIIIFTLLCDQGGVSL